MSHQSVIRVSRLLNQPSCQIDTDSTSMLTKCYCYTQELTESIQLLLTTKIAVYLMTFLIVTVAWAAHIR